MIDKSAALQVLVPGVRSSSESRMRMGRFVSSFSSQRLTMIDRGAIFFLVAPAGQKSQDFARVLSRMARRILLKTFSPCDARSNELTLTQRQQMGHCALEPSIASLFEC